MEIDDCHVTSLLVKGNLLLHKFSVLKSALRRQCLDDAYRAYERAYKLQKDFNTMKCKSLHSTLLFYISWYTSILYWNYFIILTYSFDTSFANSIWSSSCPCYCKRSRKIKPWKPTNIMFTCFCVAKSGSYSGIQNTLR